MIRKCCKGAVFVRYKIFVANGQDPVIRGPRPHRGEVAAPKFDLCKETVLQIKALQAIFETFARIECGRNGAVYCSPV